MELHNYLFTTLIIGKNDKDKNIQVLSDETFMNEILSQLALYKIKGATISECLGLWDGILEKNLKIEIVNTFKDDIEFKATINLIYTYLKEKFNQWEITVNYSTIESNLNREIAE